MASRGQKKFNRRLPLYSKEGLLEMHPTLAKKYFDKLIMRTSKEIMETHAAMIKKLGDE